MKTHSYQEQERKKRRRELAVAFVATLLIAGIVVVEYQIAGARGEIPLGRHILLFALSGLSILLLILVIFFIIRNLFKLLFERGQRILGGRLKTRLTLAFVGLTLVPTLVLFIASAGVVHTTIDLWFTAQVDESIRASRIVAETFSSTASEKVRRTSVRIASLIGAAHLLRSAEPDRLHEYLKPWISTDRLYSLQVHYRDGSSPVIVKDEALAEEPLPLPRASFLRIAFNGKMTSTIMKLSSGADLARGIAPIREGGIDKPSAVLVVDYYIPRSLTRRLLPISEAFEDYQEAKRMKRPVKTIYIMILLVIALLVILIGFWFGMSMARDITDPIQKLGQGTDQIAGGDLDVYIEPEADDELGVLVRSFNKMTGDLRKGRDELMKVNLDLESRRKYMETVLKNVAAGVLALDSDGAITTVNRSAINLLGMNDQDLFGRPLLDALPEVSATAVEEILHDLSLAGHEAITRQITLSFPDKSVSLICFANSLKDEEGGDLGAVLVFEDMTHLVRAQRMAAWREVARRIAHEIKNPLTPIQLNAQRVRRKYLETLGDEAEVLDQCTRTIIDQVEQLKNMVNEFSNFARMPAADPVPNDLNALMGEIVSLYSQGSEKITFSFERDASVPIFDLDAEQMKRAIINLLDNATAAVGESGKVSIKTSYNPELSIATIEVSDDGAGVDPVDSDRLFEPYFSKKPGGTGLGLTIVSTIVSDHNGFIRVKDNRGKGAIFIIELPVGRAAHPNSGRT